MVKIILKDHNHKTIGVVVRKPLHNGLTTIYGQAYDIFVSPDKRDIDTLQLIERALYEQLHIVDNSDDLFNQTYVNHANNWNITTNHLRRINRE